MNIFSDIIFPKIISINKESPILIGVDGIDAAGKTFFAKTLQEQLISQTNKNIILTSVDYFHYPEKHRYQKGKNSPECFYFDSYNYPVLQEKLLESFHRGKGKYITQSFDCDSNVKIEQEEKEVLQNSILIFEGIFLHRPELIHYWDFSIFLDITFETALQRNISRSIAQGNNNSIPQIKKKYIARYMPGQELYFKLSKPKEKANIIIDNNDFLNPIFITPH